MSFGDSPFGMTVFGAGDNDGIAPNDRLVQTLRLSVRALHGYAAQLEKTNRALRAHLDQSRVNLEAVSALLNLDQIDNAKAMSKVGLDGWPELPPLSAQSNLQPLWAYLGGGS